VHGGSKVNDPTTRKPLKARLQKHGGEEGIRTPDTLSGMPVFKTGAINHSATSPLIQFYYSSTVSGHSSVTQTVTMQNPASRRAWGVDNDIDCIHR
jgi:hypothetical protein